MGDGRSTTTATTVVPPRFSSLSIQKGLPAFIREASWENLNLGTCNYSSPFKLREACQGNAHSLFRNGLNELIDKLRTDSNGITGSTHAQVSNLIMAQHMRDCFDDYCDNVEADTYEAWSALHRKYLAAKEFRSSHGSSASRLLAIKPEHGLTEEVST